MNIIIHRGQNQIGGSIIEISSDTTKIIFDVGLELDDEKNKKHPDIKGLFDTKGFDAVFVSHYHSDHLGLAYDLHDQIPVYLGEASTKIIQASDTYKGNKSLKITGYLKHKQPILIGDIMVTPYLCDHSAFDSYMLMAQSNGEKILYTGDFRSNGRKPFEWLLNELPKDIDILISEGTTLSREDVVSETEKALEERVIETIRDTKGPVFVLRSSMNIDRLVTMYRASKRSNRLFLQDLYLSEISSSLGGSIPNPQVNGFNDVRVFLTTGYPKDHYRYQLFDKYQAKKISKIQISKSFFMMAVRSSMLRYLMSLSKLISFENGILIYSFWSGYKQQVEMKAFLESCEKLGLKIVTLHTSGHADPSTILRLIDHTHPKKIIPVHTENAQWFIDHFSKEIEIITK